MSTTTPEHPASGTPQPDVLAKPRTDKDRAHDLQTLVALLATDWVRGDKTHLEEIETLALELVEELDKEAPPEKASRVAAAKTALVERAAAKPARR